MTVEPSRSRSVCLQPWISSLLVPPPHPTSVSLNGNVRPKRDAGCLFTLGAVRFVCQQVASVYFSHRWLRMSTPPTPTGVSANTGQTSHTALCYCAIPQCRTTLCLCVYVCVHGTHKEKACFDFMQMLHHKNLYSPPVFSLCAHTGSAADV